MYRVGFPGWKLAARFGVPLLVKIEVIRDAEAAVFVATSADLPGLVVEASDLDQLMPAVYGCVAMLLEAQLKHPPKSKAVAAWDGEFCPA
jgi:5'-3' exonuclease